MQKIILSLIIISFSFSLDFSDGPYGPEYFDIAGPIELEDLNAIPKGDINYDGILNIQDLILIIQYIIGNIENPDWLDDGDVNNDSIVDILDMVIAINTVLEGQEPIWDFESEWNGEDCYIFINYTNLSGALVGSTTKELLLNNSPMNIHYLFISDRTTYYSDIVGLKNTFDEILLDMSPEMQDPWNSHLHLIPQKTSSLKNWLNQV